MIIALLVVLVLLMAAMAVLLTRIVARQEAVMRLLAASFRPMTYSAFNDSDQVLEENTSPPQNSIEQQTQVLTHIFGKLSEIDQKLAYARNFIWELHDHRSRDEVSGPAADSNYGLWEPQRERDEEYRQIVSRAFSRKDDGAESG